MVSVTFTRFDICMCRGEKVLGFFRSYLMSAILCSVRLQVIVKTKEALTKQAERIAKKADEHEHLINKVPRRHNGRDITKPSQRGVRTVELFQPLLMGGGASARSVKNSWQYAVLIFLVCKC